MIESMEYLMYIAVAAGGLIALLRLLIGHKLDEIITAVVNWQHRKEEDFYIFYDHMSEGVHELFIDVIKNPKIKTRDDFYKLHDEARDDMYKIFNHYRVEATKDVLLRVLPVILLPAIVFWQNWYYYLLGVAIVSAVLIAYKALVRDDIITDNDVWLLSLSYRKYLKRKSK